MNVQNVQNQTFGAIKIKGLNNRTAAKAQQVASFNFVALEDGFSWLGNHAKYIQTQKGSAKELTIIAKLKKALTNEKGVSVSSNADWRAKRSIARTELKPLKK